jgi:hypothetical protein
MGLTLLSSVAPVAKPVKGCVLKSFVFRAEQEASLFNSDIYIYGVNRSVVSREVDQNNKQGRKFAKIKPVLVDYEFQQRLNKTFKPLTTMGKHEMDYSKS